MSVRVAQTGVEILAKSTLNPEIRCTKIVGQVLADPAPAASAATCPCDSYVKLNVGNLKAQTHYLARCWEIALNNGTTLRFTNHNKALIVGGNTFDAILGLSATAQEKTSQLEPNIYEASGVFGTVTYADMISGFFRDASITELVVDWRFPFLGAFRCSTHWIKRLVFDGERWEAEVVGHMGRITKPIGSIYTRNCRFKLGDPNSCSVNLESYEQSGLTVLTVDSTEPNRIFTASATDSGTFNGSTWFRFGTITWTAGANNGLTMEVRQWTPGTSTWELYIEMPNAIAVNDTFDATPGCDHTITQCDTKFGNRLNYGGFPHMPGQDALLRGPAVAPEQAVFNLIDTILTQVLNLGG